MNGHHARDSGSLAAASAGPATWAATSHGVDPLSDALEQVRLRGALFFVWEPSWPYATTVPSARRFGGLILPGAEQIISYHIVMQGPCWGAVAGEQPVRLETGDILLVPHGDPYVIASEPSAPEASVDDSSLLFFRQLAAGELPPVVVDGGAGAQQSRLICGFLGCDTRPFNPVLESLPRMLRLSAVEPGPDDPLVHLVGFAVTQSRDTRSGGRCVLLRLSELMFVEVLRRYLSDTGIAPTGWLAALRDPVVGLALRVLHRHPARSWTLDELANAVGVSRSVLADRFTTLVGRPPKHYLAHWRMQLAARRLTDGTAKVYAVAQEVGYESEAAFSRAFKRIVGVPPAAWRRRGRAPVEQERV